MILNDKQIIERCQGDKPMITPFIPGLVRRCLHDEIEKEVKVISYGLSSFGYDVRLSKDVKIFHNLKGAVVDPKRFDEQALLLDLDVDTDEDGSEFVILPPNSYLLGVTPEWFNIPRDIQVIVVGKSTYARSGVLINCTPIEAGFEGHVVIEAANGTPSPVRVYVNEGIAQFFFLQGEECHVSYADRGGKYQGQTGVQLPLV